MAAFWWSVIADHARRGEVELTLLRLSGRLAAFVVAFLDGDAYRFWAHRHDPSFGQFSPGTLASQACVASALNDEAFVLFDWMRADEREGRRVDALLVREGTRAGAAGGSGP